MEAESIIPRETVPHPPPDLAEARRLAAELGCIIVEPTPEVPHVDL